MTWVLTAGNAIDLIVAHGPATPVVSRILTHQCAGYDRKPLPHRRESLTFCPRQRRNSVLPASVIVYTRWGRPRSLRRFAISIQMTAAKQYCYARFG